MQHDLKRLRSIEYAGMLNYLPQQYAADHYWAQLWEFPKKR